MKRVIPEKAAEQRAEAAEELLEYAEQRADVAEEILDEAEQRAEEAEELVRRLREAMYPFISWTPPTTIEVRNALRVYEETAEKGSTPKMTHVFDASRTCDYCGIAAERTTETAVCPERKGATP